MVNRYVLNEISYHGQGAIKEIPNEVKVRGFKKVLITATPDLVEFKVTDKVTKLLDENKIAYEIFTEIDPNPSIENVKAGVKAFKKAKADSIIAIGGGSSMDCAKGIGIVIKNPEFKDVRSLEGAEHTKNKSVPILAVPTTAGTGSEVTVKFIISDHQREIKMTCSDHHVIPVCSFVDPDMMSTMPKSLKAATGMDALTHALEALVTKKSWEMSDIFCLKAIEVIHKNLKKAVNGDDKALEEMALAQYVAGMGFSNVGLGVDHSMAHTLSAHYGLPHGTACAILLPTVMAFNCPKVGKKYKEAAKAMGVKDADKMSVKEANKAAIEAVRKLSKSIGIPQSLKGIVKPEDIKILAKDVVDDTCHLGNPRDLNQKQVEDMFKSLMK